MAAWRKAMAAGKRRQQRGINNNASAAAWRSGSISSS